MEVSHIISSGILEQYVLGFTTPEETKEVESYMNEFPEIKAEVDHISVAIESYAEVNAVTPSPDVKARIFDIIQKDRKEKSALVPPLKIVKKPSADNAVTKINSFLKFAAAACLFLLVGSVLLNISLYNKYKKSNADMASVKQELNAQKQVAIDMNQDLSVVKNKMAMPVVLNGTPHSPESVAKIFWMKNTGDVYVDPSNLPPAPSDKQYQLWAIIDGKPVNGGMISSKNGDIFRIQKMHSFGKVQAFAITLEKAGGSATPTMDEMVVKATI